MTEEPALLLHQLTMERFPSWFVIWQEAQRPVPPVSELYQAQRLLALGSEQR